MARTPTRKSATASRRARSGKAKSGTAREAAGAAKSAGKSAGAKPRARSAPRRRKSAVVRKKTGFLTGLLKYGFVAAIWIGVAIGGLLAYHAYQLPDINDLDRYERAGATRLLDRDGVMFVSYGALHGRPVAVSRLPESLVQALVATEDRRFFSHFGIDPISIARAAVVNLQAGRTVQGGSTLTQQLAKNVFLSAERSYSRKIQELLLAFWLEHRFSKQEILAIYLNRVYFGAGAYGVDAAARKYFGRPVEDLTAYQSAMLVGLLKAPSRYNPAVDRELSAGRTRQVLLNMADAGYLTEAEALRISAAPAPVRGAAGVSRNHRYFADWARERAGGYAGPGGGDRTVRTTLDRRLQRLAERAVAEGMKRGAKKGARQIAMVVMAPDGAVRAMIGGRDYAASQFNRATQALRQPGSAFKPFVFLAALEAGYQPETPVSDAALAIDGWKPRNFDGRYRGEVTLEDALAESLNAATVSVSEAIGRRRALSVARRLGLTATLPDRPSLALGAGEVTLLEMTAAYAAFANHGRFVTPYAVEAIDTSGEGKVYARGGASAPEVVDARSVAALNRMLQSVVERGTGRRARIGRPAAGKTGTSQDFRDAWFIGYTADLVAGIWVGRDDASPMDGVTGGSLPAEIWAAFMSEAAKGPPRPLAGLAGKDASRL
ncbi:PBP1A family penicillin-binding protein [Nisaea acidiphila]|uniref:PBP1A family penicillin-binding protein n=1 Tax=Nisaea acidiphila TaxID=1862145 RepID=A0A9J7B092_9PROT|nr:PBP1A family penicillin-binding protein [Nisaea acidiphila]UUX52081.1 PBP1A family penicillin-binding protein [Nisaea acidiphila]